MAELFLARDAQTQQLVVIKRILPHLSQEAQFVQMFLDEARIASQLDHPNIVQLFELGHLEGSIFIAMEFVDGADLRKLFQEEQKRGRTVPYAEAAWITARVCDGLYYAHNRAGLDGRPLELIHRDVSPQNVMVAFDGRVKLVDFGIARANSYMERSQPGVIKGKFLYLSPEQLASNGIDHRADLFALGAMLYEVTTGKSPFYKPTTEAVILAIRGEDPPPPHLIVRDYPLELSRIVMKCLIKDRTRRYQQANEISRDLDAFVRMQAPTHPQRVAGYVAALFDSERTQVEAPPPMRPLEPTLVPGRRPTAEQPAPGAQFAGDEDELPTQMARPREPATPSTWSSPDPEDASEPTATLLPEEDDESTVDGSTLADRKSRRWRSRPGWLLLGASLGLGLIIGAAALIGSGGPRPAPELTVAPVPIQPEPASAPEPSAQPPLEHAAPVPGAVPSAAALLDSSRDDAAEKVEVVFRAPRGTRLSVGRRQFAVGKRYRLEPGPMKLKYRCPGRRGASGTQSFEVRADPEGAQTLSVSCRRK